jgi:hypothetical protein
MTIFRPWVARVTSCAPWILGKRGSGFAAILAAQDISQAAHDWEARKGSFEVGFGYRPMAGATTRIVAEPGTIRGR